MPATAPRLWALMKIRVFGGSRSGLRPLSRSLSLSSMMAGTDSISAGMRFRSPIPRSGRLLEHPILGMEGARTTRPCEQQLERLTRVGRCLPWNCPSRSTRASWDRAPSHGAVVDDRPCRSGAESSTLPDAARSRPAWGRPPIPSSSSASCQCPTAYWRPPGSPTSHMTNRRSQSSPASVRRATQDQRGAPDTPVRDAGPAAP